MKPLAHPLCTSCRAPKSPFLPLAVALYPEGLASRGRGGTTADRAQKLCEYSVSAVGGYFQSKLFVRADSIDQSPARDLFASSLKGSSRSGVTRRIGQAPDDRVVISPFLRDMRRYKSEFDDKGKEAA